MYKRGRQTQNQTLLAHNTQLKGKKIFYLGSYSWGKWKRAREMSLQWHIHIDESLHTNMHIPNRSHHQHQHSSIGTHPYMHRREQRCGVRAKAIRIIENSAHKTFANDTNILTHFYTLKKAHKHTQTDRQRERIGGECCKSMLLHCVVFMCMYFDFSALISFTLTWISRPWTILSLSSDGFSTFVCGSESSMFWIYV